MNCYIMKPILNYFDNVSYLLGTLFSGISTLLSEKTIVNEVAHFTPDRWIN